MVRGWKTIPNFTSCGDFCPSTFLVCMNIFHWVTSCGRCATLVVLRLYNGLHAGVLAATLFWSIYIRISVICGNMGRYKSGTSRIEFLKMLDVPRDLIRFFILVFQAHTSWLEDVRHSIRLLPLWGKHRKPRSRISACEFGSARKWSTCMWRTDLRTT
jgi:hypothetical protein